MKMVLSCAVILFSLASCTKLSELTSKFIPVTDTKSVKIFSDANINNDFPIPTDIVIIKDEDLIKVLAEMEANNEIKITKFVAIISLFFGIFFKDNLAKLNVTNFAIFIMLTQSTGS